jgi:hypothetical protein
MHFNRFWGSASIWACLNSVLVIGFLQPENVTLADASVLASTTGRSTNLDWVCYILSPDTCTSLGPFNCSHYICGGNDETGYFCLENFVEWDWILEGNEAVLLPPAYYNIWGSMGATDYHAGSRYCYQYEQCNYYVSYNDGCEYDGILDEWYCFGESAVFPDIQEPDETLAGSACPPPGGS